MKTISLADPESVFQRLNIGDAPPELKQTWALSTSSFEQNAVFFLDQAFIAETGAMLQMQPETVAALSEAALSLATDPGAERFAWHFHWLCFLSGMERDTAKWPVIPRETNTGGPLLYALLFMSGIQLVREKHAARGIAPEVTAATFKDIERWMRDHRKRFGYWGITERHWFRHHFRGFFFELGRLQHVLAQFTAPFRFYRSVRTGAVVALAEGNCEFRSDGQFADAFGSDASQTIWKSSLETGLDTVRGHPVLPEGKVSRELVSLPVSEWNEVLKKGDWVLDVHIPAGGRMGRSECRESMKEARRFFKAHFPEFNWRSFICRPWFTVPAFEELLPDSSNIVDFIRDWYLHPAPGWRPTGIWNRVFGEYDKSDLDLQTAPRDTALRHAIINHLDKGGKLTGAHSVFFPEELEKQPGFYRAVWPF